MKWIISNHKDMLVEESYQYELKDISNPNIKLVICPNDKVLPNFKERNFLLGSQDLDYHFSIQELKLMNVKYTIVGHTDKRKKYGQSNQEINEKIKRLLAYDICPILCIGEEKIESRNIETILERELEECLKDVRCNHLIIAYEPVWAIGSGKIPDLKILGGLINKIKEKTKEMIGNVPDVIYGGSVSIETIYSLEKITSLDGYLIGSNGLKIDKLKKLIEVIK